MSGSRALRLFDDLLFESPEVCSCCFARIRDRTEHDEDAIRAGRLGTGNRPTETLQRTHAGTVGQGAHDHDRYGALRSHHGRTYCGECGSPGGRADPQHIMSAQQARRRCDAIVRRLHERGYYPDVPTLYRVVETLKADPDRQGQDREILAAAVYLALQRGREAPDVPARIDPDPCPPTASP